MSGQISIAGFGPRVSVEIAPEAHTLKADALGTAALVRVEPNTMAINNEIKAGNLNITGLKCWIDTVAGVRV